MSETGTQIAEQQPQGGGVATGAPARSQMVQRLLDASSSLPAFIHDLLTTQAITVVATEAAAFLVEMQGDTQTLRNVAHIRPDEATPSVRAKALEAFQDLVRPCIAQNKEGLIELGNPNDSNEPQFCLITPLRQDGKVAAVTAVITRCINIDRAKQRLMQMQLVAGYFDLYTLRRSSEQSRVIAQSHQNVLQLSNAVATSDGFVQAAMNLCNELASRTAATRVALGWLKGTQVKVQAISHTEEFDRKQEQVQQIEGAMEECLDQEEMVHFAPEGGGSQNVSRNAQILSRTQGGNTILSLPLRRRESMIGVVTLEFLPGTKITATMAQGLAVAVDLLAAQLHDRYTNDRYLVVKAGISAKDQAAKLLGVQHTIAKLVILSLLIGLIFVCLYKPMYHVSAPFELQPIAPRTISMPFEEQIVDVAVKPGQRVKKGDLLVQLRKDILELHQLDSRSEANSARKKSDSLRSQNKLAEAEMEMFNYNKSMQDAELYGKQVAMSTIVAPFDGTVLKSQVEDKINSTYKQGDPLMELAKDGDLQAVIKVSEADIGNVYEPYGSKQQSGLIATTSDPRDRRSVIVNRVPPMAELDSSTGTNVYKVYATLQNADPNWKPGMAGEARLDVAPKPLIYIWTHKLTDFVRMKLWM